IVGSNYADVLVAGAPGGTIMGGNGADLLEGSRSGGTTLINNGTGNDTFCAADVCAVAGTGASDLPGAQPDTMIGGSGNDNFFARNGIADNINGGGGYNSAQVDPADKLVSIQQLLP
ncbi:MAG: hypothetical protein ACRDWW_04805, partial [Acidimicrobiales bacterium]